MNARRKAFLLGWTVLVTTGVCLAQFRPYESRGPFTRIEGGGLVNEDTVRTARETLPHSMDTPTWTNAPGFEADVFTFARVIFQTDPYRGGGWGRGRRLGWWVDYPDADLNISWRLQHLTAIHTDPDARVLKLTDPDLFHYPLIYMEHAGYMQLSDPEITALRKYFRNGGALFVNDFWSTQEWDGFAGEIKRVLPDREWVDVPLDHPVFRGLFPLRGPMRRLQVPTMQFWNTDHDADDPNSPLHRVDRGEGSDDMHVRIIYDDRRRPLILAIHNSDVSDGWERESEDNHYFHTYSERIAYPLGLNIIFYLMTH